jgi:hypothetical protein
VIGPTPLLDYFKRGEVGRDVRLSAAKGELAPRAYEQLAILSTLVDDSDPEIRDTAEQTLAKLPQPALKKFLGRSDTPAAMLEFFKNRGIVPDAVREVADDDDDAAPLIDTEYVPEFDESAMTPSWQKEAADAPAGQPQPAAVETAAGPEKEEELDPELAAQTGEDGQRLSASQLLAKMNMMGRLKAAVKGTREMRAILIRDPNKMISAAVLSSPKLTDAEIASFAKMQNVAEDVLRVIAANRQWTKSYSVILALAKNAKTPVAMSMNFLNRLTAKDVSMIAVDRNVPEALRIAARKKAQANRMG